MLRDRDYKKMGFRRMTSRTGVAGVPFASRAVALPRNVDVPLLPRNLPHSLRVVILRHPLPLLWTCVNRAARKQASVTSPPLATPFSEAALGRLAIWHHVGVDSLPAERIDVLKVAIRYVLQEGLHVRLVSAEAVGGVTGDAYLVLAAELEAGGFLCDVRKEPQPFLLRTDVRFEHARNLRDLRGEGGHGGGEDGVEFAKLGEVAGEVEGEGIEGVGVLAEDGERVCGGNSVGRGRVGSAAGHVWRVSGRLGGCVEATKLAAAQLAYIGAWAR